MPHGPVRSTHCLTNPNFAHYKNLTPTSHKVTAYEKTLNCKPSGNEGYREISGSGTHNCISLSAKSFPAGVSCVADTNNKGPLSCSNSALGPLYGSVLPRDDGKTIRFYSSSTCKSNTEFEADPGGKCFEATGEAEFGSFSVH